MSTSGAMPAYSAVGAAAVAGHDARDVGAVAAVVDRHGAAGHEILERADAAQRQIGVRPNARIDDRDRDAARAKDPTRRRRCAWSPPPGGARRLPDRRHRTPASRETLARVRNSLLNSGGAAEHHEGRARFGIRGPHRGAAIEQAIERRVAFGGRRELHDDARGLAGRHRAAHGLVGVAGGRRNHSHCAHDERHGRSSSHQGRVGFIKNPGPSQRHRGASNVQTRPCRRTKTEPGYLTPAQLGEPVSHYCTGVESLGADLASR